MSNTELPKTDTPTVAASKEATQTDAATQAAKPGETEAKPAAAGVAPESEAKLSETPRPKEIGGPKGPEPTRFGDWERDGRCVDF